MRPFPVITKARFLKHGEKFVVGHGASRSARRNRRRRLTVILVYRDDSVLRLPADLSQKIRIAVNSGNLNSNGSKCAAIVGAFDAKVLEPGIGGRLPS